MSEVVLTGISSSDPVPGVYLETVLGAGPAALGGLPRSVLVLANKSSAGSGAVETLYGPDTNVPLTNLSDARALFGIGSEAYRACKRFWSVNVSTPLYVMLVAEASGASATGAIEVTGTAAQPGTVEVRALDQSFSVGFAQGDGYESIASAIASAINSRLDLPVVAVATLGDVDLTARNVGLRGRVAPHARIHGRGNDHGAVKGQSLCRQHVARCAVGQPKKRVSRCRSHHQSLSVLPRLQMRKNILPRRKHVFVDGGCAQRFKQ